MLFFFLRATRVMCFKPWKNLGFPMFLHIQSMCEYKLHAASAVLAGLGKTWILAAQTLPKSGPEGRFWRDSGLDGLAGMVEVAMLAGLAGQLVLVAGAGGKMELCKGIKAV